MVALLVSLKLRLFANSLRRSAARTVLVLIGGLYAAGATVLGIAALVGLRTVDASLAADASVLGFAAVTLAWTLLPLLVFGVDDTLDPAVFALLPVRAKRLMPGLLVAGLLGVPGAATALVALASVLTWTRGSGAGGWPVSTTAALVAAVLGVATCLLLARALTSAFARLLRTRRFRDAAAAVVALLAASIGLAVNALMSSAHGAGADQWRAIAHSAAAVVGWTPFGLPWSVPGALATGRPALAALRLALALAVVVALWLVWRRQLDISLCSPLDAGGDGTKVRAGHGLIERLYPDSPAGAVAGRCLRYWRRDPRYVSAGVTVMIMPLLLVGGHALNSQGTGLAVFAPVMVAGLLGTSLSQDTSYDGSALWLHVSSGVRGRDDRLGRVLALYTWAVPVLVLVSIGVFGWAGEWRNAPVLLGLATSVLLAGTGVASWVSAVWQAPVPPAGSNPFSSSGGMSTAGLVSVGVNLAGNTLVNLPVIACAIASIWVPALRWVVPPLAIGIGVTGLLIGVRAGGARLDRRWPEVLTAVSAKR